MIVLLVGFIVDFYCHLFAFIANTVDFCCIHPTIHTLYFHVSLSAYQYILSIPSSGEVKGNANVAYCVYNYSLLMHKIYVVIRFLHIDYKKTGQTYQFYVFYWGFEET